MLTNIGMNILVTFSSIQLIYGYTCYKCSYSADTDARRFCIEDPERLGFGGHLPCNATSYCVLQEQYSLQDNKVTSYFRSCSGVSWGNECTRDWSHITCRMSCRGNYCNENQNGTLYVEYMNSEGGDWNSAQSHVMTTYYLTYAILVTAFLGQLFT